MNMKIICTEESGVRIRNRILEMRKFMQGRFLDAVVLPTGDPHISEYPSEYWSTREWISGFTGSAGTVVVTGDDALLWTDGRYYIQAEQQLAGTGIKLQRAADLGCPKIERWLCDNLKDGNRVACDGHQLSVAGMTRMYKALKEKNIELVLGVDPVNEMWVDRPLLSDLPAFVHKSPFCGISVAEKLEQVRGEMKKEGVTHYLISSLDAVAWLLNIRGNDIPCTPLVLAYVLLGPDKVTCFIDEEKCPAEVEEHFNTCGIIAAPYRDVSIAVEALGRDDVLLLDPKRTCAKLYDMIGDKCQIKKSDDIVQSIKAVKSEGELDNLRGCIDRDCAVVSRLLGWIDLNLVEGNTVLESLVSQQIEKNRCEDDRYIGPSFETIAAYGEHAALMHYAVTPESDAEVKKAGFLLIDTGGQYYDGTTDITRTVACGELTEQQRHDYTLVLKAHIALSQAVFIEGTCGPHLDILARGILAREGLNYRCGTGHSIGYCLNVHEGPHGISNGTNMVVLKPGMIVTNEPGIYREGSHGIRIENTLLVREHNKTEFGNFYSFEILSFCPIDIRPVMDEMLTTEEKDWLQEYHDEVERRFSV